MEFHAFRLHAILVLVLLRSAMSYVEKHLLDGETIVYETRLHWIALIVPVLLGLLFAAASVAMFVLSSRNSESNSTASQTMTIAGVILLAVSVILVARGIFIRNGTEMTVTNKRVFVKVGMAARRTIELLLSRVESIGVEESVMGRILGYGTVIVHGTGGTPEIFNLIAHPLEFRTQVQQQIEKSQANSR
jgi:uncharacterized membrane protein YdbT with pleckstrin-like domain